MGTVFEGLKRIFGKEPPDADGPKPASGRRDPSHVGRSSAKEIEEAPPARAGELAGHAVERVDT